MRLKIYNGYTEVSRMKNQSSDLFRFLTNKENLSIGRKDPEFH